MADHLNSGAEQEQSLVSSVIVARGDITHRSFHQTTKLFESKSQKDKSTTMDAHIAYILFYFHFSNI